MRVARKCCYLLTAVFACGGGAHHADESLSVAAEAERPPRARPQLWRSEAPILEAGSFFITPFGDGGHNRLGGRLGTFARGGSTGVLDVLDGDEGLLFRYAQKAQGETGFWLHVFDDRVVAGDRTYLHTGTATSLTVEIRGSGGGAAVVLGIADRERFESDSWRSVATLSELVPDGRFTNAWQRIVISLENFPDDVETEELASIVFSIDGVGEGKVQIRNLGLLDGSHSTTSPSYGSQSSE